MTDSTFQAVMNFKVKLPMLLEQDLEAYFYKQARVDRLEDVGKEEVDVVVDVRHAVTDRCVRGSLQQRSKIPRWGSKCLGSYFC